MINCEGGPFGIMGPALGYLAFIALVFYVVRLPRNRQAFIEFEKWRDEFAKWRDRHFTQQENLAPLVAGMTAAEKLNAIHSTPCPPSVRLTLGDEFLLMQSKRCFGHVIIESPATVPGPLKLCGVTVQNLAIANIGEIHLEKCKIGALVASGANPDYRIKDCMIGWFAVKEESPVQHLTWNKGYLGQFDLQGWPREKPFVGDVSIRAVKFSTDTKKYDAQWARDTRSALSEVDNSVAAGLFHGHALRLNRSKEDWPSKCVGWFYKNGCDYGNSIGLPAFWFAVLFVAIYLVAFTVDTHVETDPVASESSVRWQTQLTAPSCEAKRLRAITYAFQSINPLNLITSKQTVFVSKWWAAYLSAFLALCAAVAFGMFLVSVRRRFKLE